MKIQGYRRPDGKVGIRNHLIVLPTSVCAGEVATRIGSRVPGAVSLAHTYGCCQIGADHAQTVRTLIGMGNNPNVGGVLVVSLGCEGIQPETIVEGIAESGKPAYHVGIQEAGGSRRAIEKGAAILRKMRAGVGKIGRVKADLADVVLGMECGGSDATSGLAANPALGLVSDMLIAAGGTSILSETTELIGAEHVLARRARNRKVASALLHIVRRTEERAIAAGVDLRGSQPTPGNIAGGITTIEEKSLGCIHKAGSARVEGVIEYAEEPSARGGLYVMDTPGQDIESMIGMVAGSAQIVIFTTGRGTPTGCPIAPVIKVTGNSATYRKMKDDIDIDAGGVIDGSIALEEIAGRMFDEMIAVCNGKLTKAEIHGHHEFAIYRVGYTY